VVQPEGDGAFLLEASKELLGNTDETALPDLRCFEIEVNQLHSEVIKSYI